MRNFLPIQQEKPLWRMWLVFFIYTAFMALFVQFVLLPYVLPGWHAGNGLLISYLDSISAHRIASSLAERIHQEGWSVWEVRPELQGQIGITAAIYALTVPKPWVLIPILAALHATATFALFLAMNSLVSDRKISLLAVLPFLLYPSAMSWYTQVLKDGYFIAGTGMIIYGWAMIGSRVPAWRRWKGVFGPILSITAGTWLVWVVRPYMVDVMCLLAFVVSVFLTSVSIMRYLRQQRDRPPLFADAIVIWAVFLMMTLFKPGVQEQQVQEQQVQEQQVQEQQVQEQQVQEQQVQEQQVQEQQVQEQQAGEMEFMSRLSALVDANLQSMAQAREGFRSIPGTIAVSNIDSDIELKSTKDVILYLPRAAQIAFLSPFPYHWFGTGSLEANTMMRRLTAFEMLGVYFSLLFLPYAIWHWRKRVEIWIVLIYCVPPLLMQGIVVANIGALYRMRYGFLMTLVALGLAGFITLCRQWKHSR